MGTVTVVGIGADGWEGLPAATRELVAGADVLLGGSRHLAMTPEREGQTRERWPSPLLDRLPDLLEKYGSERLVVLASGDPLVSGVASTLISLIGPERVEVVPAVSSVALAHARMKWPSGSTDVVTLVGRDPSALTRWLSPRRRLVVLSSDGSTPGLIADLLTEAGYAPTAMTVLSDLGASHESRHEGTAGSWEEYPSPALNVVCLECECEDSSLVLSTVPGLPDNAFANDGQLTKRDIRASALARLAPSPGELLWDVGAGAGSVGIEWMRSDPRCRAIAVESDPERAARCAQNAGRLGVPALRVVNGTAPQALLELPSPDAIFIGGGATVAGVVAACWDALMPGGRLVVHGVTLETESLLVAGFGKHGGELTRLSVERADAIGGFTGWTPARAVVQWSVTR